MELQILNLLPYEILHHIEEFSGKKEEWKNIFNYVVIPKLEKGFRKIYVDNKNNELCYNCYIYGSMEYDNYGNLMDGPCLNGQFGIHPPVNKYISYDDIFSKSTDILRFLPYKNYKYFYHENYGDMINYFDNHFNGLKKNLHSEIKKRKISNIKLDLSNF